jgi:hypothetical protein
MTTNNSTEVNETQNTEAAAVIPEAPAYDTGSLTPEELEIFTDAQDLSDGELAALPAYLRDEISAVRAKAKVNSAPAAETVPAETTPAEAEEPEKTEAETEPETTTADTAADADNRDEVIRMLTEENRKLNARYSTLQGKYNAEIKNQKPKTAENDLNSKDGDTPEELFSGTADGEKKPVSTSDDEISRLAAQYGVDADVAKALCGIVADRTRNFETQIAEERTHRLDATFDRVLRSHCGGLGLEEIGTHPLFNRYATDLVSSRGTSAAEDIAAAKASFDFDRAASIVNKVVEAMKQDNVWNFSGYSREPGNANSPAAAASPAANAPTAQTAAKAKSVAIPHSSGNAVSTLHTARTEQDIVNEYNELEARLRKGDFKAAARMEQVSKEYTKLLASKNQS